VIFVGRVVVERIRRRRELLFRTKEKESKNLTNPRLCGAVSLSLSLFFIIVNNSRKHFV